jgi:hypothetical protein
VAHVAQHEGAEFSIFCFVGQRSGIVVVVPGTREVMEIEAEPTRLARGVTENREQSRPKRGRALTCQESGQIALRKDGIEGGLRAEHIILELAMPQDLLNVLDCLHVKAVRFGAYSDHTCLFFGINIFE